MAFWEKLFPDRQKKTIDAYLKYDNCSPSKDAPHFKEEQIRLLVFRDCSVKGRRLLFDSKSVCKIKVNITKYNEVNSEENHGSFNEIVDGFGYKYTSMQNDVRMLGEMVFGCIAMSFCGTMFKVHEIDNPHRMMCTMISPVYDKSSKSSNSAGSSVGSVHDFLVSNNASDSFYELSSDSWCNDVFNASGSSFLSPSNFSSFQESASNSSLSSHGSYLRRCQMSSCYAINKTHSSEDQSSVFDGEKPMKLGCAVLFELTRDFGFNDNFLLAHMTVIQQNLSRLMCAVVAAYLLRKTFLFNVLSALEVFRQNFKDLCTAPRINKPVWLTLTSCMDTADDLDELAGQFLTSLMNLQDRCDTKVANFFLSRLLTGVLSHHLSWVPTVLPSSGDPMGWGSWKVSSTWSKDLPQLPYNPFRMQLSDLYGGKGLPSRMVRVLVMGCGTRSTLVSQLLFILSYFIRLSHVTKRKLNNSNQVLTPEDCEFSVKGTDELISIPQDFNVSSQMTDPFLCPHKVSQTPSSVDHTYEIHSQTKVKFIVGEDDREVIEECGIMVDITGRKSSSNDCDSKIVRTLSFNEKTSTDFQNDSLFPKLSHSKTAPHMQVRMTCSVPTPSACQYTVCRGRRCSDTAFSSSQYLRDYQNLRFSFGHQDDMLQSYLSDSYNPRVVLDSQVLAEARNTFCEQSFHWITHYKRDLCDHGDVLNTGDKRDLFNVKEGVKQHKQLGIVLCPLPRLPAIHDMFESCPSQAHTLYGAYSDHYIPDLALLGLSNKSGIPSQLHQDLVFTSKHSLHCETKTPAEALCILADVDNWSVELVSSQTPYLDHHNSSGVTLGMSPLVSSLLETTCHMWKVGMPAQTCLVHLESRLQELYCHSKVMADYLMTHQVADMSTLISDLDIAVNDVPLLLAIAITHTPHLASLYGIGFK